MFTHLVIGLGEVGGPLLDVLRLDASAAGYDLGDGTPPVSAAIHICYPFSDSFVDTVVDYVVLCRPAACIIHSTVPPGTTRSVAGRVDHHVAYSPIHGRHSEMHRDLLRYTKFVAACDSGALESAHDMLIDGGLDALAVDWAPEQLELAKLLSTTYPALLIAWAQEMERYCREVGGEYPEITAFFAEQVHLPRFAFAPGHIGGHCLMPNLDLLDGVRRSDFVDAIRASNKMVEPTGERPTPASLESIVAGLRNPLS